MKLLLLWTSTAVLCFSARAQGDDPCSATPLTVGTSCSYSTYSNASATASTGVPSPLCASYSGGDVWFTATVPASGQLIVDMTSGVMTDSGMAFYTGTCGSLSLYECDDDGSSNGLMSYISASGLTPGSTIFIRVWEYGNNNNGTFGICATTPPPPPANDDCTGAYPLTVNPDYSCGNVTSGTIYSATPSSQSTTACGGTENDDVWFSFVATNTTHEIDLLNVSGSTSDMYHSVWSGNCPSLSLVSGSCSDPNSSTVSGLTIGQTYYIRVYSYSSLSGATSTFDVCIGTPPPPPSNDNCNNAIPVTMSNSTCNYTSGTIASATASSQSNGCGGTANDDVWFSFVATSVGANISLSNITGGTSDLYHSVYAGSCGSPGAALVCSDPNTSTITGLTIGNTYYVRVYSWSSSSGATSNFDLCILGTGPCGTPNNQDFCVNPATLTEGGADFSANTSSSYTADTPANLNSIFCGSIENNSWYAFTATATSHTFNFAVVNNCNYNWGVQAQVYNVTTDANGCCTNFSSMSNCYNPGTNNPGVVTATGLTIGNTYYLMVDGNSGDQCDFTVIGWSAVGIIPLGVDIKHFNGITLPQSNELTWDTYTEKENDRFIIERSFDGASFEAIGTIAGAGHSDHILHYSFTDMDVRSGITYYRLKQIDYNGDEHRTEIIALNRVMADEGSLVAFPNPTTNKLFIELQATDQAGELTLVDMNGNPLKLQRITAEGYQKFSIDVSDVAPGIYLLEWHSNDNQLINKQRISVQP